MPPQVQIKKARPDLKAMRSSDASQLMPFEREPLLKGWISLSGPANAATWKRVLRLLAV